MKPPNLHMLLKQNSPSLPRNLALRAFGELLIVFLTKVKAAIHPLFNNPEVFSSASDKAKLFAKNFSKNSYLDDSGISLPVLSSRTNLKLHFFFVTPKMVKKVIMNLDLSKASAPNSGVDKSRTPVHHALVLLDNVQRILFRQTSTYTRVGKRKYANIGK